METYQSTPDVDQNSAKQPIRRALSAAVLVGLAVTATVAVNYRNSDSNQNNDGKREFLYLNGNMNFLSSFERIQD